MENVLNIIIKEIESFLETKKREYLYARKKL